MRSRTVTEVFQAPRSEVFTYLSDIENLPRWATEFVRELKVVGGRHKVVTSQGELFFEIRADEGTGVIDMLVGPTPEELWPFPTRVVELPGGQTAFTFTMLQPPGSSDELFERQHRSLLREFENLGREFSGD